MENLMRVLYSARFWILLSLALFAITSNAGAVITKIVGESGAGPGKKLHHPWGIAVDSDKNVYVAGGSLIASFVYDGVLRITPEGVITQAIGKSGDGLGNNMYRPRRITVDGDDNLYAAGEQSHNVIKRTPDGTITELIDSS